MYQQACSFVFKKLDGGILPKYKKKTKTPQKTKNQKKKTQTTKKAPPPKKPVVQNNTKFQQ